MKRKSAKIRASQLHHDSSYQRPTIPSHIRHLAEIWDDDQSGVIHVSERVDGTHWVIDGQHRILAQAQRKEPDHVMMCVVYSEITREEEAILFAALNYDRDLTPLDIYHSQVAAGDKQALAIRKVVQGVGLRIARSSRGTAKARTINSIRSVERTFLLDGNGEFLRITLDAMKEAWGDGGAVFRGSIIEGIGNALFKHPDWQLERLVSKLAGQPGGPIRVDRMGRDYSEVNGLQFRASMVAVIERIYLGRKLRAA